MPWATGPAPQVVFRESDSDPQFPGERREGCKEAVLRY